MRRFVDIEFIEVLNDSIAAAFNRDEHHRDKFLWFADVELSDQQSYIITQSDLDSMMSADEFDYGATWVFPTDRKLMPLRPYHFSIMGMVDDSENSEIFLNGIADSIYRSFKNYSVVFVAVPKFVGLREHLDGFRSISFEIIIGGFMLPRVKS